MSPLPSPFHGGSAVSFPCPLTHRSLGGLCCGLRSSCLLSPDPGPCAPSGPEALGPHLSPLACALKAHLQYHFKSNHGLTFRKHKSGHAILVHTPSWPRWCFQPTRGPFPAARPALHPSQPGVPALGALAVPSWVASSVLPGPAVSTTKPKFEYDKVLGSPSLSLLGVPAEVPPALFGDRWQQVELRQVTLVRQVREVSWQPPRVSQGAKVTS